MRTLGYVGVRRRHATSGSALVASVVLVVVVAAVAAILSVEPCSTRSGSAPVDATAIDPCASSERCARLFVIVRADDDAWPIPFDGRVVPSEPGAEDAALRLVVDGRPPVPVLFEPATIDDGTRNLAAHEWSAESQPLPAGSFLLELKVAGGRVLREPVELVDGETTRVTFGVSAR